MNLGSAIPVTGLVSGTGDKDPYTQWAHGEYIVGTDNTCHNVPVIKNWVHFECSLQWVHNVCDG